MFCHNTATHRDAGWLPIHMNQIGYFHGVDPAACLVRDGEVVAFVEEERLVRFKHADGLFPIRAIDSCLKIGGIELADVDRFVYGWDGDRYADEGPEGMAAFYRELNERHAPNPPTTAWQQRNLSWFRTESLERRLHDQLVRFFGVPRSALAPLVCFPHHETHAAAAFFLSPFEEALALIVDGSGDSDCTSVWRGSGSTLEPLFRVELPHSLGWFYAALTEYLGFKAYDGEYKVMGLAAYGRDNPTVRERLAAVVQPGPHGFDYTVDPRFLHLGGHNYSDRFTDELVEHLGVAPRVGEQPLESIHEDIAFETQRLLEETTLRLMTHFRRETGIERLVIGGGVGLNVKMNSRFHRSGLFEEVEAFPIPSDSGLGIGAAVGLHVRETGRRPRPVRHVYWGPSYTDGEIETQLESCGLAYRRCDDVAGDTAELLAGRQGRRLVPGRHGRRAARAGRPVDPGRSALRREPRPRQLGDQVPRVLAALLSQPRGGGRRALSREAWGRALHDPRLRGHGRVQIERSRRGSRRRHDACADRRRAVEPHLPQAAQGVRGPHRRPRAPQHVVQHQGRGHRLLAAGRPAHVLEHRARRARHRLLSDREAARADADGARRGDSLMRVLVVAPHADDETLGMGGTIARLVDEGHEVTVAVLTGHGDDEPHPLWPREQWDIVRAEARKAMDVLGVERLLFEEIPAVAVADQPVWKLNAVTGKVVLECSPEALYVPFPFDLHKDHRELFHSLSVAWRPSSAVGRAIREVHCYEVQSETHWNIPGVEPGFLPNHWVDITASLERKLEAAACYESQMRDFPDARSADALEALARWRGAQVGVRAAEAFVTVRLLR